MHAVRGVAGAQADDRNGQRFGEHLANFGRRHLAHDREATGVDHRPRIVDQLLRAIGGLPLREKPTELRHAHRRDADVSLYRNAGLDDRFDVFRVMLVAFTFHHLGAGLRDILGRVVHCLHRRQMKAHVRHVDHAQTIFRSALDRLRHEHHFLERNRRGVLVTEQHHPAGVGHAQDIDADAIGDDRCFIVVDGELDDRLAFFHLVDERGNRNFLARGLRCGRLRFGHLLLRS